MDSFEFNKMAGALLGALGLTLGLYIVSGAIFSHPTLTKPGYDLPAAEAEGGEAKSGGAPAENLPELLAKADPAKGQADTKPCQACHNFEKGAGVKIGPPLYGVLGRPKASIAGFDYSDGLKAKGGNWTFEDLDHFIKSPKSFIAGTKMAFGGEATDQKRADLLVYLNTLSDKPEALPKVEKK